MRHPVYWRSNLARRLYVLAFAPLVWALLVANGSARAVGEITADTIARCGRIWRAPKDEG